MPKSAAVRIEYAREYERCPEDAEFSEPDDAVRWLVKCLAGWCLDDDISIILNGKRLW